MDRAIDPCTDFDAYANGPWRAANPIPAQASRWGRRAVSRETNRRQLQELLQELASREDWPKGSIERLLGDHYASCMNEAKIEALGLTPLAPLLADIDAIRSQDDLQRNIRRLHDLAIPVGFGLAGAMDNHDPERFIANIVPGTLGLPPAVDARERYRARVAQVLALAGAPESAARESSVAIVALEKRLAEPSLDVKAAADPTATDHHLTFAQLVQLTPGIDWNAYFAEAGLPRVDLNVEQPNVLRRLDTELHGTSLTVWKAYLRWRLLDSATAFLPASFAAAPEASSRALRCAESTESLFGNAVGRKYVERHFPPAAKAKVQEMVRAMMAVLKEDVGRLEWMRPRTRKTALEKLEGYDLQVGYPDNWRADPAVDAHRDAFWANVSAARRSSVAADRRRIGKPTERDLWQLPASSPGAYIDLQLNQMVLPAGFLQPPAFGLGQSDAENYGAIGSNIAHDLTHAIDLGGSELDLHGRPRPWWSDADRQEFQNLGRCVSEQFEGYSIEPGVHHKGSLVLSEAIGDLAGARVAFVAFRQSLAKNSVRAGTGPTPEQRFFIAFGQMRGDAMRLEAQRQLLASDPHPAPRFRVIGTVSNLPEFQRAFSCPAGAEMVRPPEKRCAVVW